MKPLYLNGDLYVNLYAINRALVDSKEDYSIVYDSRPDTIWLQRGKLHVDTTRQLIAGETRIVRVVINRICMRMALGMPFEAAMNEVLPQFNSIIVPL